MRVIIKVKKEQADGLLQLLKLNGFKPEPDHPVSIDFRMTSCVLIGELEDSQLEDTRMIRAVEGIYKDLTIFAPMSTLLPEIPSPPATLAEPEPAVQLKALPPPIPPAKPAIPSALTYFAEPEPEAPPRALPPPIPAARLDPSQPEFYKRLAVPQRSLDYRFDFSQEDADEERALECVPS